MSDPLKVAIGMQYGMGESRFLEVMKRYKAKFPDGATSPSYRVRGPLANYLRDIVPEAYRDKALDETPLRWVKMMREMTSGYAIDVPGLFKTFDQQGYDGMVVVGPIAFSSMCEHHLLPFMGHAWVGYLPNKRTKRIVGLSKLARVVDAHARRLQVQERMTHDIATDIAKHLRAAGVGVRIESQHTCMSCRGIKKEGIMRTQTLLGSFKKHSDVRAEFVGLCRRGQ